MDREEKNDNGIDLSKLFDKDGRFQKEKQSPEYFFRPGTPKIIRWLIKHSGGLIKNEKQAAYLLFAITILAILISIFLFFDILSGPKIPPGALEQPEYGLPIKD